MEIKDQAELWKAKRRSEAAYKPGIIAILSLLVGICIAIWALTANNTILAICGAVIAVAGLVVILVCKKIASPYAEHLQAVAEKELESKKREEVTKSNENRLIGFYVKCLKSGAEDTTSPGSLQKIKLIAETSFTDFIDDPITAYNEGKRLREQSKKRKQDAKLTEQIMAESKENDELNKYNNFYGREKRIAILKDELRYYTIAKEAIERQIKQSGFVNNMMQEREHDWATAGGIASGLAGGAAGAMTAMELQKDNIGIRNRNAERDVLHQATTMRLSAKKSELEKQIKKINKRIENSKISLVDDSLGAEDLLDRVEFLNMKYSFTETGALKIRVNTKLKSDLKIFDNTPAVIDGVINAIILQEGEQVSTVSLAVPFEGISSKIAVTLYGISSPYDKNINKSIPITVEYAPKRIWAIEANI